MFTLTIHSKCRLRTSESEHLRNQREEARLKPSLPGLSPYRRSRLPVFLPELSVSGFTATSLGAFQNFRSHATGNCHIHVGVRTTVDLDDQEDRAESWLILMKVRIHKRRLERRSEARHKEGGTNGIIDRGLWSCKRRA